TGYKLGLYSNDTLVLTLSDSSTLATFSGAVSMGALTATTGTFSGLIKGTAGESARFANDGAFITFWNTANSVRSGYLQIQAAGVAILNVQINQGLELRTNNTNRLTIVAGGAADFQGNSVSMGAIRANSCEVNPGTVSQPAYSFTADPNTGMYRSGVDQLSLVTNSLEALRITSARKVQLNDGGIPTDVAGIVISTSPPVNEDYVDGTIWCVVD
ncbi:hypothetical protein LCGC14_2008290, partial [marine sediment metagenome]